MAERAAPRHQPAPAARPSDAVITSGSVTTIRPNETATEATSTTEHASPTRADVPVHAGPSCPHCGTPLIDHKATEGPKAGAWHCDACGGCFARRGSAWFVRDGHPPPLGWDPS